MSMDATTQTTNQRQPIPTLSDLADAAGVTLETVAAQRDLLIRVLRATPQTQRTVNAVLTAQDE